jgi:hypothetical protein
MAAGDFALPGRAQAADDAGERQASSLRVNTGRRSPQ